MIIPDKETEAFLCRSADSRLISFLCRLRLIRPFDSLRAAALLRDENAWRALFGKAFFALSVSATVAGLFFLMLSRWSWSYAWPACFFSGAALIVCAVFKHKSRFCDIAGALIIGLLIFLTDSLFGVDTPPYRRMVVWTGFLFLWESSSFSVPSFAKTILAANAAVVVSALQNPLGLFTPVNTAAALIVLNSTAGTINLLFKKTPTVPVLLTFAAVMIPPAVNAASGSTFVPSDLFLLAVPLLSGVLCVFKPARPAFGAAPVLLFFAAVLSVRLEQTLPVAGHLNRIAAGLIPALFVLAELLLRKEKPEKTDVPPPRMTVRQILSCLDVSVFSEKNEAALLTGGKLSPSLPETDGDLDFGRKALIWTGAAALLFAFSKTAAAGIVLTAAGILLYRLTKKDVPAETLLLGGVLILTAALAVRSPVTAAAASGVLLSLSVASPDRNGFVADTALLFAGTLLFAAGKEGALTMAGLLSAAGTGLFLFPAGRCYWRKAAVVFMILPLIVFAAAETAPLFGRTAAVPSRAPVYAVVAEALMLFVPLYRDLNAKERIAGIACAAAAGLCAALFSAGAAACFVLAGVAYFTNGLCLGKTAARGLLLFIPAGFLQTRLSFDVLAAIGLAAAAAPVVSSLLRRMARHA